MQFNRKSQDAIFTKNEMNCAQFIKQRMAPERFGTTADGVNCHIRAFGGGVIPEEKVNDRPHKHYFMALADIYLRNPEKTLNRLAGGLPLLQQSPAVLQKVL